VKRKVQRRTAALAWQRWDAERRAKFEQTAGPLLAKMGYPADLEAASTAPACESRL
jgi:hypothetical protein